MNVRVYFKYPITISKPKECMNFRQFFGGFFTSVIVVGMIMACSRNKSFHEVASSQHQLSSEVHVLPEGKVSYVSTADMMFGNEDVESLNTETQSSRHKYFPNPLLPETLSAYLPTTVPAATTTMPTTRPVMFSIKVMPSDTFIDLDHFIRTLINKESEGDDYAKGDEDLVGKAYGCLQIRQICLDDTIDVLVAHGYSKSDLTTQKLMGNRKLSIEVFKVYMNRYANKKELGRQATYEDMARMWNGGPLGYKKESTRKYWKDLCKRAEKCR